MTRKETRCAPYGYSLVPLRAVAEAGPTRKPRTLQFDLSVDNGEYRELNHTLLTPDRSGKLR